MDNKISVVVSFCGKQKKSDSIIKALESLDPEMVKGKGLLTIMKGKKKFERILYPFTTRKLLVNSTMREIFEKQIKAVLE